MYDELFGSNWRNRFTLIPQSWPLKARLNLRHPPTLADELHNWNLLHAFLHSQFVVKEMIGQRSGIPIHPVDPYAIAVAIGADQADLQIFERHLAYCSLQHTFKMPRSGK